MRGSEIQMKFTRKLALKYLQRKPGRTAALILLSAFLALSVFGGSLIVMSLQNGLDSYESRLGADIIIVPKEARSHGSIESILLQGIPGYFYMNDSALEKARNTEGVEIATPQFYLASASAGCCSVSVQIIGFDGVRQFNSEDLYCSTIVQPMAQLAETSVDIVLREDRSNLPSLICLPVSYVPGGTTKELWPANT